jgi:hypothetical protein
MHESVHQAAAILLAGLFARSLRRGRVTTAERVLLLGVIALISLLRPTWAFLSLPVLLMGERRASFVRVVASICGATFLVGAAGVAMRYLWTPYYYDFTYSVIAAFKRSPSDGFVYFVTQTWQNVTEKYIPWFFAERSILEAASSLLVLGLTVCCLVLLLADVRRRRQDSSRAGSGIEKRDEMLLHVLNLGSILVFTVIAFHYTNYRDYRFFASPLLLSLLLFAVRRREGLLALTLVSFLVTAPEFVKTYREFHANHFNPRLTSTYDKVIAGHLVYDEDARSPWCNSLLLHKRNFQYYLTDTPPGIGLNHVISWQNVPRPFKSRFVLMDHMTYQELEDEVNFKLIRGSNFGNLYLNRDAPCS